MGKSTNLERQLLIHKAYFLDHPAPLCRPNTTQYGPKLTERWGEVNCKRCLKMRNTHGIIDTSDGEDTLMRKLIQKTLKKPILRRAGKK